MCTIRSLSIRMARTLPVLTLIAWLSACAPDAEDFTRSMNAALRAGDFVLAGESARSLVLLGEERREGAPDYAGMFMGRLRAAIDTASLDEDWEQVLQARLEARSFVAWADTAAPGRAPERFDPSTFGLPASIARWEYIRYLAASYDTSGPQRRDVLVREREVIEQSLIAPQDVPTLAQESLARLLTQLDSIDAPSGIDTTSLGDVLSRMFPITEDSVPTGRTTAPASESP